MFSYRRETVLQGAL